MAVRYFTYRRSRRHYYLFDICYFANLLLVTHVWLLRRSALLQTVSGHAAEQKLGPCYTALYKNILLRTA